jgi:hypothetical protein
VIDPCWSKRAWFEFQCIVNVLLYSRTISAKSLALMIVYRLSAKVQYGTTLALDRGLRLPSQPACLRRGRRGIIIGSPPLPLMICNSTRITCQKNRSTGDHITAINLLHYCGGVKPSHAWIRSYSYSVRLFVRKRIGTTPQCHRVGFTASIMM